MINNKERLNTDNTPELAWNKNNILNKETENNENFLVDDNEEKYISDANSNISMNVNILELFEIFYRFFAYVEFRFFVFIRHFL